MSNKIETTGIQGFVVLDENGKQNIKYDYSALLNSPGEATAEHSGLMSAEQVNQIETNMANMQDLINDLTALEGNTKGMNAGYVQVGQITGTTAGIHATAEGNYTLAFGQCAHAEGNCSAWIKLATIEPIGSAPQRYRISNIELETGVYQDARQKIMPNDIIASPNREGPLTPLAQVIEVNQVGGGDSYEVLLNQEISIPKDSKIRSVVPSMASGDSSHAEGLGSQAVGRFSHAEGGMTVASGHSSHAQGSYTQSLGDMSHAEGFYTKAIKKQAHAEGVYTTASGLSSHAEGQSTTASGDCAHAEGTLTEASGTASHAEGWDTIASGTGAHSEGYGTIAASQQQHVQGHFNEIDDTGLYLHIVGNGKGETNRSNAHTIDKDGNAWFAGTVTVGAECEKLATEKYVNDAIEQHVLADYIIESGENEVRDDDKGYYSWHWEKWASGKVVMWLHGEVVVSGSGTIRTAEDILLPVNIVENPSLYLLTKDGVESANDAEKFVYYVSFDSVEEEDENGEIIVHNYYAHIPGRTICYENVLIGVEGMMPLQIYMIGKWKK